MSVVTSIWGTALSTLSAIKNYLGGDSKQNATPVISSIYDLNADEHNLIVAGLSEVALRTRYGNLICVSFSYPNVTAGGTGVDFYRACGGDTALKIFTAPFAGKIIAIAARSEGVRTAGTCTINIEVGGSAKTISTVIDATNTQKSTANQTYYAADVAGDEFSTGDEIGVTYTTDGSWAAGSTPSIMVDLILALGD